MVSEGYWWKDPAANGPSSSGWHFAAGIVPEFFEGVWRVFHQNVMDQRRCHDKKRKKIIRAFPRPLACGGGSVDSGARMVLARLSVPFRTVCSFCGAAFGPDRNIPVGVCGLGRQKGSYLVFGPGGS